MDQEVSEYEKPWDIIEDLRRCFEIYKIHKFIYEKKRCVASEINKITSFKESTIYKHIAKSFKEGFIDKEYRDNSVRNGGPYIVVARPELKYYLMEFEKALFRFFNQLSEYNNNL